jgi:isoprenylcysteine carboxyl methyltransferase (ICMT) family protein YpbQ
MITLIGLLIYAFSMLILFTVIYQLKSFWTVKLIIAKNHELNESFIFKYFKHPNYFLNIIPELLAINLICKSWITLSIMLPIYLILLTVRIKQENLVMKETFSNY